LRTRLVGLLVASFVVSACEMRARIPEKVTTDGLLSLKSGMTYAEVERVGR